MLVDVYGSISSQSANVYNIFIYISYVGGQGIESSQEESVTNNIGLHIEAQAR